MYAKPTMPPPPPKPSMEHLNAFAIGMRNRGQFYMPTLSKGPISVHDWLRSEFERCGYDVKDMADL